MKIVMHRTAYKTGPARVNEEYTDINVGNWPYEPGAHGRVEGVGTYKLKPKPADKIWSWTYDDSDDPHKAKYVQGGENLTFAEAKQQLTDRLKSITKRRANMDQFHA